MDILEISINTVQGLASADMKDIGKKILLVLATCNTKEEMEESKEIIKNKLNISDKEFSYLLMAGMK